MSRIDVEEGRNIPQFYFIFKGKKELGAEKNRNWF
jgi:hypothetical protein